MRLLLSSAWLVLGLWAPAVAVAQVVITAEGSATTADGSATATGTVTSSAVPPPPSGAAPPPSGAVSAAMADVPDAPGAPSRVVGFGTAFGGGIAGAGVYTTSLGSAIAIAPAIELPTLEGLIFIDDHLSIDFSIPLWNTIVLAAFGGLTLWGTNVLLDFSIGDDWVRFVVGPQLGFSYAGVNSGSYSFNYTQVSVGALVGLELLSPGRAFGFRVMTRPNVGVAFTSSSTEAVAVSGGALLELALISYFAQ